jgi:hypothetical protein
VYGLTNEVAEFTPFGLVTEDVAILADEIVLSPGPDAETLIGITDAEFAAGVNVVLIEDEMVAWRDLKVNTDGTITISHLARGVMDTTPTTHANGAAAWFLTSGKGFTDPVAYASDGLIGAKLLPKNDAGTLAIGVADRLTCDVASRGDRPYLPTAIQLNGDDYPATIVGQLVVSWSPRDRLSAWDYDDSGVTAIAEADTVTRIKVYGDGGTLKHTEDVAAGTATWTYLTATEHAENGGIDNTSLRVVVSQVRSVVTGAVGWALNDLPFAFAEADSVVELESRQSFDWSFGR